MSNIDTLSIIGQRYENKEISEFSNVVEALEELELAANSFLLETGDSCPLTTPAQIQSLKALERALQQAWITLSRIKK